MSHTSTSFTLPATPHLDYDTSPWVRVSHTCAGATVTIAPAGHIKVVDQVPGRDHRDVAIRLYAYAPGRVILTVSSGRTLKSTTTISITGP